MNTTKYATWGTITRDKIMKEYPSVKSDAVAFSLWYLARNGMNTVTSQIQSEAGKQNTRLKIVPIHLAHAKRVLNGKSTGKKKPFRTKVTATLRTASPSTTNEQDSTDIKDAIRRATERNQEIALKRDTILRGCLRDLEALDT